MVVGEVFNIGGGSWVVLVEVINIMEGIVGCLIKKNFVEKVRGDVCYISVDVFKVRKILGY